MRILVCVKRVPITGGKMVLTADGQALETKHLGFTISPHEECAVEEAVRIGGEVVVLTLGPAEAEEQLRDCMAIGADRGILLKTRARSGTRSRRRPRSSTRSAPRSRSTCILFGNESADAAGFQVGIRVAHALGLPVVTGLKKIEVGDGRVRCERDVGGARDVYEAPLPAVLTVLEGTEPAALSVRAGAAAREAKPLAGSSSPPRPEQKLEKLRLVVPEGQGKQAEILEERRPQVVAVLQSLGVA